jgi:hypothetical protein
MWTFVKYDAGDDTDYLRWLARNPDEFVIISARSPHPAQAVLHRASCATIGDGAHDRSLGDSYLRACGPRAEIEGRLGAAEVRHCQLCL